MATAEHFSRGQESNPLFLESPNTASAAAAPWAAGVGTSLSLLILSPSLLAPPTSPPPFHFQSPRTTSSSS